VTLVTVRQDWERRARRVAGRAEHVAYASNIENMYVGLLAELAVLHHLVEEVADLPAEWLSPAGRRGAGGGHPADIRWGGLDLDVKLIGRGAQHLKIKVNAQGFHHVFVEWARRFESFRILGVLLPHPPETFEPAVRFEHHVNRRSGAVSGWLVPKTRLQPLASLIRREDVA
jgi:hypothetical protein